MSQIVRHQLWIAAAAAAMFFTNLGAARLWDDDETIYASCAREMFDRGDWVVPRYNGGIFFDKPPLMFWTMIGGFELFGVTEFAARFFSAVLGVGTALVTYHLGRLLFRAEAGFWAGLIVASNIGFVVSARAATVDSALTLVTTLMLLLFVVAWRRDPVAPRAAGTLLWAAIWACAGVAVLAKGPVGMLLPAATIGLFLLWSAAIDRRFSGGEKSGDESPHSKISAVLRWMKRSFAALLRTFAPRNVLSAVWQMRPLTAIVVTAAVALPWYVLVGLRTDGAWLEQFFAKYNVGPFLQGSLGHRFPVFFHLLVIFVFFFPWSLFLGPAVVYAVRQVRARQPWQPSYVLLLCWVGVFFAFWSVSTMKLPHHVLPAYPALALLTGSFLFDWLADPAGMGRLAPRHVGAVLMAVGLGIAVTLPIVAQFFVPGEEMVGAVGLVLVAGGLTYMFCERRRQPQRMASVVAVTAVVFLTGVFGWAAQRIDRQQHSGPLVDEIRQASPQTPQIAGYRFLQASLIFYAGEPLVCCDTAEQLRALLARTPQPYIVTTDEYEADLKQQFPGEFQVFARRPRFLRRNQEVLVYTRRGDSAPAPPALATSVSGRP